MAWFFSTTIDERISPHTQCISDADFTNDVMSPWVAYVIGGVLFLLAFIVSIQIIFKNGEVFADLLERNWKDAKSKAYIAFWKSGSNGHPVAHHATILCLDIAYPMFVLGTLQYNFELGYSLNFVLGAMMLFRHSFGHKIFPYNQVPRLKEPDRFDKDDRKIKILTTRNTYQSSSTTVFILVFIAQMCLFVFYCASVWENGRPCFEDPRQYCFYLIACLVKGIYFTASYLINRDKSKLDLEYWDYALYATNHKDAHDLKVGPKMIESVGKYECCLRHWLSYLVNGLMRCILLNLSTIQIAQSPDALDFVLNVVAAVFIIELDDYNKWGVDPQKVTIVFPQDSKIEVVKPPDLAELAAMKEKISQWEKQLHEA